MLCSNSTAAHVAMRKVAVSLADSIDLRVILSVMYTIVEVIRTEMMNDDSEYTLEINSFIYEIGELLYWVLKCHYSRNNCFRIRD